MLTSAQPVTAPGEWRSLTGWGRWPSTRSRVVRPEEMIDLAEVVADARLHIARGLGRSYGDAAQLAGGTVVDMTAIRGVELDPASGVVTARAGSSLGEILDVTVPQGWFLPVTPGTRHVTMGGAIAADVHGKNHHRDGSLGEHIDWLRLITADGSTIEATPGSEAFSVTVGGMGLTGVITDATMRLIPIETAAMSVHTTPTPDLPATMQALLDADAHHRYSVAWVDLSDRRGRGLVMGANHASTAEIHGWRHADDGESTLRLPDWCPAVVNGVSVSIFNRLWHTLGQRRGGKRIESIGSFFYPLDRIGAWNRLYGKKGFLQYQFVVPLHRDDVIAEIAKALVQMPTPVSLAVLKRMGDASPGLISFPMPGWTLAVDMPIGDPDLGRVLDECDLKVANAGGRVYLAKDSRLGRRHIAEMYPDLPAWRETRAKLDPEGRLRSNLSQRLGLIA